MTEDEYEDALIIQQRELIAKCARFDDELGYNDVTNDAPIAVGADDKTTPGHVRPNYIFRMSGGKEIQIDTRTGERTVL